MPTDYDAIADTYPELETISIRLYLELPTFLDVLGDVGGRTVLDLACGTGAYSRIFAQAGAGKVVAVDLSEQMLAIARQREAQHPLDVEYVQSDVAELPDLGTFDVVTAIYLLHYSPTEAHMARVAERISAHMAPGSRFVSCVLNPELDRARLAYDAFGFTGAWEQSQGDAPDTIILRTLDEPVFELRGMGWNRAQYERALHGAGLTDIEWHPYRVSKEGIDKHGEAHWQYYLDNPHACIVTARRPG